MITPNLFSYIKYRIILLIKAPLCKSYTKKKKKKKKRERERESTKTYDIRTSSAPNRQNIYEISPWMYGIKFLPFKALLRLHINLNI